MNKEIEASRKRQEAAAKERERKAKMSLGERMMSEPLTPAQIINNQMNYHGHVGNV